MAFLIWNEWKRSMRTSLPNSLRRYLTDKTSLYNRIKKKIDLFSPNFSFTVPKSSTSFRNSKWNLQSDLCILVWRTKLQVELNQNQKSCLSVVSSVLSGVVPKGFLFNNQLISSGLFLKVKIDWPPVERFFTCNNAVVKGC